jgi:hypothetical protein
MITEPFPSVVFTSILPVRRVEEELLEAEVMMISPLPLPLDGVAEIHEAPASVTIDHAVFEVI